MTNYQKRLSKAKAYASKIESENYESVDERRIFKTMKYGELRAYERWQIRVMLEKAYIAGKRSKRCLSKLKKEKKK